MTRFRWRGRANCCTLRDGGSISLTAAPVRRILFGRTVTMLGFNGQYPGPLIQVDEQSTITVRFVNRTDFPTAVHWHGVRLDNRFDGAPHVTQDPVPPGGTFDYTRALPGCRHLLVSPASSRRRPAGSRALRQPAGAVARPGVLRAGEPRRDPDARRPADGRSRADRVRQRRADARADGTLRQRAARQRRAAMDVERAARRSGAVLSHQRLEHPRLQPVVAGIAHAHEGGGLGPWPLRAGIVGRQRGDRSRRTLRDRRAIRGARRGPVGQPGPGDRSHPGAVLRRDPDAWRGSRRHGRGHA